MRPSAKLLFAIGMGAVGAITLVAWAADETEEKVSLDQLPRAVKATILAEAKGGTIREIEREREGDRIVYEAEVVIDGRQFDVEVSADGTLLGVEPEDEDGDEQEEEISLDQMPPAARRAVMQYAGSHQIAKTTRERGDGITFFEAEWIVDGREHEAKVTADGALVEMEEVVDPNEVPVAVKTVAANRFPADAEIEYDMKMIVLYEIEAEIDGKEIEVLVAPTGRVFEGDDDDDDADDD